MIEHSTCKMDQDFGDIIGRKKTQCSAELNKTVLGYKLNSE